MSAIASSSRSASRSESTSSSSVAARSRSSITPCTSLLEDARGALEDVEPLAGVALVEPLAVAVEHARADDDQRGERAGEHHGDEQDVATHGAGEGVARPGGSAAERRPDGLEDRPDLHGAGGLQHELIAAGGQRRLAPILLAPPGQRGDVEVLAAAPARAARARRRSR